MTLRSQVKIFTQIHPKQTNRALKRQELPTNQSLSVTLRGRGEGSKDLKTNVYDGRESQERVED